MGAKTWSVAEVRSLARQAVEGRQAIATARGAYLRALVETTQAQLAGESKQEAQLLSLKLIHRKFYPVVLEAVTTPDIAAAPKAAPAERKRRALERNRRSNFARSAYGTIKRWLRAPDHDLLKLDAMKVTKSQLLQEAPPSRKQALTTKRIQVKAEKRIDDLLTFIQQIAKADQRQATAVLHEAVNRLYKQLAAGARVTTDAQVAAQERRPLRVGHTVFVPTEPPRVRTAA